VAQINPMQFTSHWSIVQCRISASQCKSAHATKAPLWKETGFEPTGNDYADLSIRSKTKQRVWEQRNVGTDVTQRAWLNGGGRGLSLRVTPAAHLSRHSLAVELFLHHMRERALCVCLFVSLALSRWA
jgi:hypothetical protein